MLRHFIAFNNWVTVSLRRVKVSPNSLLLLVPHCLQSSQCGRNVTADVDNCAKCGSCDVAGILALRDRYGIQCSLAGGGKQALLSVKERSVKAIVAVACEKELAEGIRASFPKPVLAVTNQRPNGPCRDTEVDLANVENALETLLDEECLSGSEA